jgi:hypothetical protein
MAVLGCDHGIGGDGVENHVFEDLGGGSEGHRAGQSD